MVSTPDISVAIIVINWNGQDFTTACLNSLRKVDYPDFKVFLVDNGSANDEGKKIKANFPEIDLIETGKNLGFAGGNNVGIRKALQEGFSHILLLNNDTLVEPDFLSELVRASQRNANAGVIQPLILFLHNPKEIWSAGGRWKPSLSRAITLGDRTPLADYRVNSTNLEWATGCAMLVSRAAIEKTGLFNEQYFVYFEDVDWSLRIRNSGFSIHFEKRAKIYHEAGASSKKKHAEGMLSPQVFYYNVRNQLFIIRSHGENKVLSLGYHLGKFTLWMGYFLVRRRFAKFKAVVKGIREGISSPLIPGPWH